MTKAELIKAKKELARLNAIIAKAEGPKGQLKLTTKSDPIHGDKGYVLVMPQFESEAFCDLFRKGPKRLAWGDKGRGHPRWVKDLGAYRCLASALDKL